MSLLRRNSSVLLNKLANYIVTSTAKQVLGNCERMVFASFVGNSNFDSFNPNFLFTCAVNFYLMLFTCAVNFYLMILVVNLYIVLVYCYTFVNF